MTKITISAHVTTFLVVEDRGDGRQTILAEFPRYADAYAAAHLIAREMGIPLEEQPDGLEGGR